MKTKEEILGKYFALPSDSAPILEKVKLAMEEYASQFKSEWLSVEKVFPNPYTTVLFCTDMGYVSQGYRAEVGKSFRETYIGQGFDNVTHWMPLPKPPIKP